ncbi:hypothetical protein [Dactylosporangium sp. CA-233914]|uniref:hypothetical protein n=1 Tax=Dactylosporangium sp. CA-233914 TaxID=3239934 RepID=UPI003D8C55A6
MIAAADKAVARDAFRHADALEREVLQRFPDAWRQMDAWRQQPPVVWPQWCLLPMAASTAVALQGRSSVGFGVAARAPVAQVAALYAWRYSRAVYLVEPGLLHRLLSTVPDALTLDDVVGLPSWCVYVPGGHPEFPGQGLWAHLEHDAKTGRPELRLILDAGGGLEAMLPIPVYLDRPSVTEALADFRATALATADGQRPTLDGADVRGAAADATVEADIVDAIRPGVGPGPRRTRIARDRQVWAVGYSTRT